VSVACIGPAGEQLVYGASVRAESSYAPQDDFDIAPRLLEKLRSGPAAGIGLTLDELTAIRSQYYACLGWSAATGAPGRAVLERLGLDDLRIGRVEGQGRSSD
jgi:aldehyde:ferredoxin oxidoreductase